MNADLITRLRGPVYPIPPAFTVDGRLNPEATSSYVRYLVASGARAVMVTAGTSRLNLLAADEVGALNAAVVAGAAGDALVIAANAMTGSTRHAIGFARDARDAGADVLLVYFPERYYTDEAVVGYFEAIAQAVAIPLMLHAVPMRSGVGGVLDTSTYDVDLLTALYRIPAFVGLKEEQGDPGLRERLVRSFADRLTIVVAGGGMSALMVGRGYGVQSYLSSAGNFRPSVETEFFALVEAGRVREASDFIGRIEKPLFEVAVPMGWHRAMRGLLAVLDLMPVHERGPLPPPTENELKRLRRLARELEWL
jgi:dihydrodipicolinate synthase/N-acetylneuraminate lyase